MKVTDLFDKNLSLSQILRIKDRDKLDQYLFDVAPFTATSTGLKTWVNVAVLLQDNKIVIQVSNTPGPFNWASYFLISVEDKPKILTTKDTVKLKKPEVDACIAWVKLNHEYLKKIGLTHYNNGSWLKLAKNIVKLTESVLLEMSTLQPEDTNIIYPMKLIKVGGQHGFRVKVSNSKAGWDSADNFSVSVDHEPQIMTGTSKIDADELKKIYSWIRLNYAVLTQIEQTFNKGGLDMQPLLDKLRPFKVRRKKPSQRVT